MKQRELCLGRGCESPHLHQKRICQSPWLYGTILEMRFKSFGAFLMGVHSFDRASSNRVDNTSEQMLKLNKSKRKRLTVRISSLNTA